MNVINQQIKTLAEQFRQELDLKPWDEFEREIIQEWDQVLTLTDEARDYYKKAKRQCGKSTKGLLLKLAEAKITKRVLLIAGPSGAMTKALYYRARELAERLNLDVEIEMVHRNAIIYSESFFEV